MIWLTVVCTGLLVALFACAVSFGSSRGRRAEDVAAMGAVLALAAVAFVSSLAVAL